MTIAKILVPLRGDNKGERVLNHAISVAREYNAHIECIYCRTRQEDLIPFGVAVPSFLKEQIANSISSVSSQEEEHVHGLFNSYSERNDLELVPEGQVPPRDRVTLGWYEETGRQADLIGVHGRLADLVAVAKPDREQNLGVNTLHAALMHTGRPVLMCPPRAVSGSLLDHVAIAWNGSAEVARAVALGVDLIQKARAVTVLTAGKIASGASVDDLNAYLAIRGVEAGNLDVSGSNAGAALLSGAQKVGASLLLMGAYSHSRGRESLFGGVSQHVVDHADLPVVLVH